MSTDNQASEVCAVAIRLIEEQKFEDAVSVLEDLVAEKPDGDNHALLALAHFQLQDYKSATINYEASLKYDPDNGNTKEMLCKSKANALAEVNVFVPDLYYFERDDLLAEPTVPEGALPATAPPVPKRGLFHRFRLFLGHGLGFVASILMGALTLLVGKIFGYRDEVWTNWYRRSNVVAILILAYMRERLNKDNLKDTYPEGVRVAYTPENLTPPEGVLHYRTTDGTWNNLRDPKEGAALTRFQRNVSNRSISDSAELGIMSPNPREISRKFLTRGEKMKEVPFLNLLAASWINFQNHDWVHHGEIRYEDVHKIPLAEDDPARIKYRQEYISVPKTQVDPTREDGKEETPATFINEVTHWWDGSQIYGSNQATLMKLRTEVDGKLRVNGDGTLPIDDKGIEETGFTRNWWVGLSMLHTLFTREHNAICDYLKSAYPDWDDIKLFNVARLVNAAVMAKIHSVEWTPAILPNPALTAGLNANWYGVLTNTLRSGKDQKTVANINVRNPELGGVVGNPINAHGEPYGLTEEFVEVYRLHSLLPETIQIRDIGQEDEIKEEVPFVETRQAGSSKLTKRVSMGQMFYSFGKQHPGQLIVNNFPRFMQELSIPGNPLFDMGAVDILRARERGVPRYNEFRRQLQLNPIRSFEDLIDCKGPTACQNHDEHLEHLQKLKDVYGSEPGDVEKLDLLVGTLSEEFRPDSFGFGETLFQIFILNASRRLQADRFYTDYYNEKTYTPEGLKWVDDSDFKKVILRHYPELAGTGLANIKNAFEPWDTGATLDESRHPLRGFDKDLKSNPWLGDAHKTV